jgi:hypothetical protein
MAEAKAQANFSYYGDRHISYYLNGGNVTVNNSKATIKLGIPKSSYMEKWFDEPSSGLTVSPPNAKIFGDDQTHFFSSNEKYALMCIKNIDTNNQNYATLMYADRDVTISDSFQETIFPNTCTITYNCSLKKGWNYFIFSGPTLINNGYFILSSSTTLPAGYSWHVVDVNYVNSW